MFHVWYDGVQTPIHRLKIITFKRGPKCYGNIRLHIISFENLNTSNIQPHYMTGDPLLFLKCGLGCLLSLFLYFSNKLSFFHPLASLFFAYFHNFYFMETLLYIFTNLWNLFQQICSITCTMPSHRSQSLEIQFTMYFYHLRGRCCQTLTYQCRHLWTTRHSFRWLLSSFNLEGQMNTFVVRCRTRNRLTCTGWSISTSRELLYLWCIRRYLTTYMSTVCVCLCVIFGQDVIVGVKQEV